ncbi:inositol-tetrakisphosphate 1-kinase 4-like isoform X1 [Primulina huaijiensis]|uniref:inositol-tetrakisphosphate 1-kinase 4-like isoform X1 n=1 Tax=Primulina huaijiensis TaxID=1492673 RepID=UPI003CC72E52
MQLNGEISDSCIRDEEEEEIGETHVNSSGPDISSSPPTSPSVSPSPSVVIGCALTSKKKKSFLQPKLIRLSRSKGIQYVSIDLNRPLLEQGPFDIILQKLTGKEWSQSIKDYQREYPAVIILDPPQAIQHVHNRQSMLEEVAELKLPDYYGKVSTPRQLVVMKDPAAIPDEVAKAGLRVPLVVKPLFVDGSAKSHELFLAYDQLSPSELEPPMVLQEFINHGGVLFKVYVIGESVKVTRRFSLPDITKCDLPKISGVFRFPRVSCAAASADEADLDPAVAELPPRPLLEGLARELRNRLGLRLFNVDMIRQKGTKDLYYVIDINYFPAGYGKMPEYEHIFTDFVLGLVQNKHKQRPPAA